MRFPMPAFSPARSIPGREFKNHKREVDPLRPVARTNSMGRNRPAQPHVQSVRFLRPLGIWMASWRNDRSSELSSVSQDEAPPARPAGETMTRARVDDELFLSVVSIYL